MADTQHIICKNLPHLLSSFIDTFVDFTVSGLFLPPNPNPNPLLQTTYPSPDRLIAIGDLHGDLQKSKQHKEDHCDDDESRLNNTGKITVI
ncbi:Shewanella-like protein phosphatase 2 [Camellia lanceoleosa]|uniref:Shewanella-like protein phosphatase 2 n=1 Tax=Camellia lanceoleosa TaxID=1840588 RepID=A0ACC0HJV8_9ERIC|nr:Shewanella-like protein phosphatase 2 [Camellia lanceoleosa]